MKGYDNYRDVNKVDGMDWMPKIPAHWEQKKLKFLAEIKLGKMLTPDNPGGYFQKPYLRAQNVGWMTANLADVKEMWFSAKELELLRLRVDDLIISEGGEVGRTAIWKGELDECYIQNSVHKLTCKEDAYPRYMLYLFSLYGHVGYFDSIVNRISLAHLTGEKLKEVTAIVPPLTEQRAIAQFLDAKTAQLDQLIAQKQQMLALLREERASLINHAVTKGLDAGAPMRNSGVAWLGEVPAHWEVKRLKHLLTGLEQGWSPSCESREADPDEWGVLKVGCVNGLRFNASENKALPADLVAMPEYEVKPGDFLISRANTKELVGSASLVESVRPKLMLCDKLFRLFFTESANKEYILLVIGSGYGRSQIQTACSGASSSMQNISQEFLKNMIVLLPGQAEQRAIVEYVAEQTRRIEETGDVINQEIALLQEYRAALIAEAVTGQIDVRHYEPALEAALM